MFRKRPSDPRPAGHAGRRLLPVLLVLATPQWASAVEILQAPVPTPVADAGYAVAVSEGWIAVGVPGEDDGAGAVYVFDCRGVQCAPADRLEANEPDDENHFGAALALDADTLAVGSPGDGEGRVTVFVRSGASWTEQAEFGANDGDDDDRFGGALALDTDRLLVGAVGTDQRAGAAHVFERSSGSWLQSARIVPVETQAGEQFAAAVALVGDVALFGAPYRNAPAEDGVAHGAAFVFALAGGIWSQQQVLQATLPAAGDLFGWSVALAGDVAAVGAPMSEQRRGTVHVYARSTPSWTLERQIVPAAASAQRLGWSIALDGDTLLAGAPFTGADASAHCGATYAYTRDAGAWTAVRTGDRLPAPAELAGWSVALDGPDRVIGAPARAIGNAPHAGIAQRIVDGRVVFRDDYESPLAICAAP